MSKKQIKNLHQKLQQEITKLKKTFEEDVCPTFVPAPPELTRNFNHYLEEAKRICPEHEGIQLLDPLNEKGCKMGQVLRASIALSEFLSECQTNANCSGHTREN